jgi:hypothetical protein
VVATPTRFARRTGCGWSPSPPQADRAERLAGRVGGRPYRRWQDVLDGEQLTPSTSACRPFSTGPQQAQSGGQTIEQATHLFDLARLLAGEVSGGYVLGSRVPDGPGDILHACTATLRFAAGAVGSFANTCLLPRGFRLGMEIAAPGLAVALTEHELVVSDADGARTYERAVDPLVQEDRAFVAAVRGEARRRSRALRRGAPDAPVGHCGRGGRGRRPHPRSAPGAVSGAGRPIRTLGVAGPGEPAVFDARESDPDTGQAWVRTVWSGIRRTPRRWTRP